MGYLVKKLQIIWWTTFYYIFNKFLFFKLGKRCRFEGWIEVLQRGGKIIIGDQCHICRRVEFSVTDSGILSIGNSVFIGPGTVISAHKLVEIGDNTLIAEYVCIHDNDHNILDIEKPISQLGYIAKSSFIGNGCRIGAGAKILKGSILGKNSVLGAGSVLAGELPDQIIATGIPTKVLKHRVLANTLLMEIKKNRLAILFHRLGPYHHARLAAVAQHCVLTAIEFSSVDHTYAWDQVKALSGFQQVTLFEDGDADTKSLAELAQEMIAALTATHPDIVAIPGWSTPGALTALSWCNQHRIPSIIMSDSTAHDEVRRGWKEAVKSRVIHLYSAGLVGGKPHVDYLSALGMPRQRIFTSYDVVDNSHFSLGADQARQDADNVRTRLALPTRFFLASNRFIEKKNLPRLLDAYARYRHQAGESAWTLVLLGDGPLKPKLQDLIRQQNLSPWVLMPGFKQYDELPAYYGLAGAYIQASTTEQWGLVVNEAMAAGLPVLVSNRCGCAPDLVEEGHNGYTFDPYDVAALAGLMRKISADDCDRAAMGQASRDIIARWTPQTFAENLCKAAEAAMNAPRPQANLLDKALLWALMRR